MHDGAGPWFDKPPLSFWIQAVVFRLFGVSEWTARLPSAIFGILAAVAVYGLGVVLTQRRRIGLMAAAMFLSTPHVVRLARFGTTDMMLVFWTTISLIGWWLARERPRWAWLGGVAFGLAILTKGAGACIIPMIVAAYTLMTRDGRMVWGWPRAGGWIVGGLLGLSWHLAEWQVWGTRFVNEYLGQRILGRVTTAIEGHQERWHHYLRVLKNKAKPWSWVLAVAWPVAAWRGWQERDHARLFLVVWIGVVVVAYSLAASKLHWYVLPVYPALVVLVAWAMDDWWPRRAIHRWVWAYAIAWFVWMASTGRLVLDDNREIKDLASWMREHPTITKVHLVQAGDPGVQFYLHPYPLREITPQYARSLIYSKVPWAVLAPKSASPFVSLPVLREGEQYLLYGRL